MSAATRSLRSASSSLHDEKGEIVEHVAGAQGGVELDAVDRFHALPAQRDVLEAQIAVPVSHPALVGASRKAIAVTIQPAANEAPCRLEARPVQDVSSPVPQPPEALLDLAADLVRAREARIRPRGAEMEPGQRVAHPAQIGVRHLATVDTMVEHCLRRDRPHPHQPLEGRVRLAPEPVAVATRAHRRGFHVDLRREAPIELDLEPAHPAALLDGAVIEEVELHRLLQLVGDAVRHQYHRAVGFVALEGPTISAVNGAGFERFYDRRPVVRCRHFRPDTNPECPRNRVSRRPGDGLECRTMWVARASGAKEMRSMPRRLPAKRVPSGSARTLAGDRTSVRSSVGGAGIEELLSPEELPT